MKYLLTLALCALCLAATVFAADIAPSAADGSLWGSDMAAFNRQFAGARYAQVDEHTLRFTRKSSVKFGELNLTELLVSFDPETKKVCLLQGSVYNKGDDGPMEKEMFTDTLKSAVEALNTLTGVAGKPHRVSKRDAGIKLQATLWQTEDCAILLEAAASGKRKDYTSEFIRVAIGPDEEALERGGSQDVTHRNALREKVKKEDNGDVWIEGIPMVDQGEKGYCVPATVSRVFAHYGMDGVDQHTLAALCKSSGANGTSTDVMARALGDISRSFHMRVNPLDKITYADYISAYNAAAKKLKKPLINPRREPMFDPDVLMEARAGKDIMVRKWMKPITKAIDAGLPVLWSVVLAFPEQGMQQAGGGHMRLIIGYNEEKGTIIYSDSWGAGHEKKEMPAEQACAMSQLRYILKPMR